MRDPIHESSVLQRCLVGGEDAASFRSSGRRRFSLLLSILLQVTILAALILIPLFVRGERLSPVVFLAPRIPGPRGPVSDARKPSGPPPHGTQHVRLPKGPMYVPPTFPAHAAKIDDAGEQDSAPFIRGGIPGDGVTGAPPWLGPEDRRMPVPAPPEPKPEKPRVIRLSVIDPGKLVHRVEPVYPPLARQTHLEGTVRLRAVIGTDGAMREVEILSGHVLLAWAARDAVLQWRYKPTLLNGQPVEVETQITVVFTLRH